MNTENGKSRVFGINSMKKWMKTRALGIKPDNSTKNITFV